MTSGFYKTVYRVVKKIPPGQVATYGQIATLVGKPRGARLVGWALKHCPENVPWQRVINSQGMISIENLCFSKKLQAELLQKEGVEVVYRQGNYWINLKQYLWQL